MDRRSEKRMFPTRDFSYGSDSFNGIDNPASSLEESTSTRGIGRPKAGENLPLRMTESKPQKCPCLGENSGLKVIILCILIFSVAITVALVVQIYYGTPQVVPHGGIVSDYEQCSQIGSTLLQKGGSAVDAAVGTVLCLGVVHPHVTGLGGGGLMIIHHHGVDDNSVALDFREIAPNGALEIQTLDESAPRAQLVGVPGQLSGLYHAQQKHGGRLKWEDVVKPSIELARKGFVVSEHLYNAMSQVNRRPEPMNYMFEENITHVGQLVHRRLLAETLTKIAKEGADALYKKDLGRTIVDELRIQNGTLSFEDFRNYSTLETVPLNVSWNGYTIEATSLPSSGPIFLMALKLLEHSSFLNDSRDSEIKSILQALKVASKNFAKLDDPNLQPKSDTFVKEYMLNDTTIEDLVQAIKNSTENMNDTVLDIQKSHASTVVALDSDECYVSIVSGLGSPFGSRIVTSSGIVLNDALKSFFVEEAKSQKNIGNIIEPRKRPLTSYIPAFISSTSKLCGTRLAIGSSDSSLLLEVVLKKLALNLTEEEALEAPRFVTSFTENKIFTEQDHTENFTNDELESLTKLGYTVIPAAKPYPSINMIMKYKDTISGDADSRGGGTPSTF